jgi:hypothetical protein
MMSLNKIYPSLLFRLRSICDLKWFMVLALSSVVEEEGGRGGKLLKSIPTVKFIDE